MSEKQKNPWEKPSGIAGLLTVIDNQELGKLFMGTALVFFLLGGVMALLMRTQLAVPENHFIGPEVYNRLFTMHGSTMMYLVVVPFVEGLAMYLLPMLIGSRDLAYPYVAAFSYWTYLFGGLAFYGSFLTNTVPDVGWFAYTPLSESKFSTQGTDFWSLALTLVSVGDLAAGAGLTVSVIRLRAPGMSINRMPLFAWAWLVTGVMITFGFTTLFTITTLMLPVDRALGTHFFDPDHGGSTLLWQHLFWFFGHPEVYIMFIPATGVVSSVVPVFAKRPIAAYGLLATAIVLTAFMSFGLWVHHMFATGLPWLSMSFFTAASLLIAIASGVQVYSWIATMWGSRPDLRVPMLYMLGFLSLFVLGGLTGVMVAIIPFDLQAHDTYFLVAHFHYVLIGGVIFPSLGGMHYWMPKITGKMLSERLGKWSFWLSFTGFNLTFFPMHIVGFLGMPRRVYTYPSTLGWQGYNLTETVGAYLLALGIGLFVTNMIASQKTGTEAGNDPWGGESLEWSLGSPPPEDNFRIPPVVKSRHPLWEQETLAYGDPQVERIREAIANTPHGWRIALSTSVLEGKPEAILPWPKPSYVPLAASVGLTVFLLGTLAKSPLLLLLGGVFSVLLFVRWYKPEDELLETLRSAKLAERAGIPLAVSGPTTMDWWGLIFCIAVLSTVFGNFFYSYFYIRLYSPMWPQDHLPRPELLINGLMYGVLVLSCVPHFLAMRAFRKDRAGASRIWLGLSLLMGTAFLVAQLLSLKDVGFNLKTNAYGSLFFIINWLFSGTVLVALGTNVAGHRRMWREGTDKTKYVALQMERSEIYWFYTAALGALVYVILYVSPHF